MRRSAMIGIFMIIPGLLILSTTPGCSKKDGAKKEPSGAPAAKGTKPEGTKGGPAAASNKAVEGKLDAIIVGQVVYDGTPPKEPMIKAMAEHKDKDRCLMGKEFEKEEQLWIVNGSNKGVANVVISLQPPAGEYFKIRPEDQHPKDQEMDQPHCAFIPHVVTLFPMYFDGSKKVQTGQKLVVKNSATMPHNTKVRGSETANPQKSETIPPKDKKEFAIKYQKTPIDIGCDFHPWMNAKALCFDNPYHAVTDMDGKFKIENVPSGVEVTVVAWHEALGDFNKQPLKTKSGGNTVDLKVKK